MTLAPHLIVLSSVEASMKTPASRIREESPFASPPRVRVVSDHEHLSDAVALAEALEECGAEAEVRLEEDSTDYDHVHPDAYVIDHIQPPLTKARGSVMVALSDRDDRDTRRKARSAGFDLLVQRPVEPRVLMQRIGEHMRGGMAFA
jgi:DNA-binding response OmpR family regulator